jgi:hypothetical protein
MLIRLEHLKAGKYLFFNLPMEPCVNQAVSPRARDHYPYAIIEIIIADTIYLCYQLIKLSTVGK